MSRETCPGTPAVDVAGAAELVTEPNPAVRNKDESVFGNASGEVLAFEFPNSNDPPGLLKNPGSKDLLLLKLRICEWAIIIFPSLTPLPA